MKTHVICLMASSVDGLTLSSRWRPKGAAGDLFERVHDELAGDALAVGRVTGQNSPRAGRIPPPRKRPFPRVPWFARRDAEVAMASSSTPMARSRGAARISAVTRSWLSLSKPCPTHIWPACAARGILRLCWKVPDRPRPHAGGTQS